MGDPQEAFDLEHVAGLDFEKLFKEYAPRIRAIALKRTRDRQLAEDIVQETLLKAYRYQSTLDRERPVWPWLAAIASNVCSDLVRRASRDSHVALSDLIETESDLQAGDPDPADNYTERDVLTRALASLNPRHRRILLLRSEGWNYQDIADLESISFLALQSTLHRAKERFRAAYRGLGGKKIPVVVFLPSWVNKIWKEMQSRVRSSITGARQTALTHANNFVSAVPSLVGGFEAALAVVMSAALLSGVASTKSPTGQSTPLNEFRSVKVETAQALKGKAATNTPDGQSIAKVPAIMGLDKLDPERESTPEETRFYSISASPDYEEDHTLFATGRCNGMSTCNAVFKSTDGGASWKWHPAQGFVGGDGQLLVSPDFSDGRRLFTVGWQGMQQSDNEGRDWKPGFVLPWNVNRGAFSPNYASDHRILLSTSAGPMSYSADSGLFEPAKLDIPSPTWAIVGSSLSKEMGSSVFVSGAGLFECNSISCSRLGDGDGMWKVFSSPSFEDDGVMWALHGTDKGLISTDGANTFRALAAWPRTSDGYATHVYDLALLEEDGALTAYAAAAGGLDYQSMMRSTDEGVTWTAWRINLPGFRMGTNRVIVTPTGRLLAAGYIQGIACSEDGGTTWAPRCSPE